MDLNEEYKPCIQNNNNMPRPDYILKIIFYYFIFVFNINIYYYYNFLINNLQKIIIFLFL